MGKHPGSWVDMQFVTSSISTMLVLLLLGAVVFLMLAAGNLSAYVRENIAFSVLLSDDMKETDILRFQKELNGETYVRQTLYISKKQALEEQAEAMGTDPAEFLGYNPFMASIEVKLDADYANSDSIAWIKDRLLSDGGVVEINYPQDLLDAVNRNIGKLSVVLLGLAALLTMISFALINNTVRLTIYSKRFLIHTMKLVGANQAFIRRPFLVRNVWVGILAGAVADVVLIGMVYGLVRYEPDLVKIITPGVMGTVMVAVFVFGVVITTLCALISVNRYLRMKSNELYYN